jgi:hypothetical protein
MGSLAEIGEDHRFRLDRGGQRRRRQLLAWRAWPDLDGNDIHDGRQPTEPVGKPKRIVKSQAMHGAASLRRDARVRPSQSRYTTSGQSRLACIDDNQPMTVRQLRDEIAAVAYDDRPCRQFGPLA